MKKLLLCFFIIELIFLFGCSTIGTNNKKRISGIITACKNCPQLRQKYLNSKVQDQEISQIVAYTIQECLKNE